MSRAFDFGLKPASYEEAAGCELQIYTYHVKNAAGEWMPGDMAEQVNLVQRVRGGYLGVELTPEEARQVAEQLVMCAEQAEDNRERRRSLDDIEEQLRDPDFRADLVTFCHPDVLYVAAGEFEEAAKKHPGMLLIARSEVTA